MNVYLIIVLALLIAEYLLNSGVDLLNLGHVRTAIPEEFRGWYDEEKYAASQRYLRDNTRFDLISATIQLPILVIFILMGGFAWVDGLSRSAGFGVVGTGLLFGGILILLGQALKLPFTLYETFVLEEKYGFNRTRPMTFVGDLAKNLLLIVLIGAPVFGGLVWFFSRAGEWAWLYSWLAITAVQLLLIYIAPVFIMPLFNKFVPLDDGDLKQSISSFAEKEGFNLQGIFTMDGSKRSTKSNAYFTGFGRWRRIVLFDTLIEKHSVSELVSVLAHEVGHYKLKHIHKMLAMAMLSTGLMFYVLSLFITRPGLYGAFGLEMTAIDGRAPVYAGLIFFGFLYTPISLLLGIVQSRLSRKHEYEADAFAVSTYGEPDAMVDALKKLSVDNLSNLTPHPLKVALEYSHPPVLERIRAIRSL